MGWVSLYSNLSISLLLFHLSLSSLFIFLPQVKKNTGIERKRTGREESRKEREREREREREKKVEKAGINPATAAPSQLALSRC